MSNLQKLSILLFFLKLNKQNSFASDGKDSPTNQQINKSPKNNISRENTSEDLNFSPNAISANSLKRRLDIIICDYIVQYNNIVELDNPDSIIVNETAKRKFLMSHINTTIPKIRERILLLLGSLIYVNWKISFFLKKMINF